MNTLIVFPQFLKQHGLFSPSKYFYYFTFRDNFLTAGKNYLRSRNLLHYFLFVLGNGVSEQHKISTCSLLEINTKITQVEFPMGLLVLVCFTTWCQLRLCTSQKRELRTWDQSHVVQSLGVCRQRLMHFVCHLELEVWFCEAPFIPAD